MAGETLSDLSNALSTLFAPKLARQWNRMAIAAALIDAEPGFGKAANFDVEFSNGEASNVAEGSDVGDGELNSDVDVAAVFNWSHYRQSFKVSETEVDAAAASIGSAEALMNIFGNRVFGANAKVISKINKHIYAGTGNDGGNPSLVGLHAGALEESGNYGGLARATYAEWKGHALANGGLPRPLSIDLLNQLDQVIYQTSGLDWDFALASPGVYRKYTGLFNQVTRLVQDGRGPMPQMDFGPVGAELFYRGKPVYRDKDATSGTITFINKNELKTKWLPRRASPQDAVQQSIETLQGSSGDSVTMTRIPARVVVLAKTGDSIKASVKTSIAMCAIRPNAMGYIADIQE